MAIIATISYKQLVSAFFKSLKASGVKFEDGKPWKPNSELEIIIEAHKGKIILKSESSEQKIAATNLPGYEFSEGKILIKTVSLWRYWNMYAGAPKFVKLVEDKDQLYFRVRYPGEDEKTESACKIL